MTARTSQLLPQVGGPPQTGHTQAAPATRHCVRPAVPPRGPALRPVTGLSAPVPPWWCSRLPRSRLSSRARTYTIWAERMVRRPPPHGCCHCL
jgi:hypothetical protein